MSLAHSGSFRDLKEILAHYGCVGDTAPIPYEVKERTYILCSNFLGGAWKTVPIDNMCLTRMKGGMSNMLFLCKLPDGFRPVGNEPDKTLLRVYFNPETESHLVAESVIFTLLSERHLGPQLYGIFNGGRLEEYIVSRPLQCPEIRIPEMSRKIARKLAHVHKLSVPISKEPTYLCEALERWITHLLEVVHTVRPFEIHWLNTNGNKVSQLISEEVLRAEIATIRWATTLARKRPMQSIPIQLEGNKKLRAISFEDVKAEVHAIRKALKISRSPIVFCHNDLQEGNILLPLEQTAGSKDLVFIDFEYSSYNYRAFDFANHFCEWAVDYACDQAPYFTVSFEYFPTEQEQANFIQAYLNESGEPCDEDAVARVIKETAAFVPVSHFFWGVWALLQVELSPVKFGFAEYGHMRLSHYFELRSNLLQPETQWDTNGVKGETNSVESDELKTAEEINGQASPGTHTRNGGIEIY